MLQSVVCRVRGCESYVHLGGVKKLTDVPCVACRVLQGGSCREGGMDGEVLRTSKAWSGCATCLDAGNCRESAVCGFDKSSLTILSDGRCLGSCAIVRACDERDCDMLNHSATCCNALQHTTTRCNILQHAGTYCNILRHTATHCNTLQHTAPHCNTLRIVLGHMRHM